MREHESLREQVAAWDRIVADAKKELTRQRAAFDWAVIALQAARVSRNQALIRLCEARIAFRDEDEACATRNGGAISTNH